MTPAYFAETPAPAPPLKPQFIAREGAKKKAKREAAGLPIPRSTISKPKSVVKIRGRNAIKKKAAKRERNNPDRIYGPQTFRDFLHAHPCLGCFGRDWIQQAHRFTGGMGRKGRWQDSVPLCGERPMAVGCHRRYDDAKATWSRENNLPHRAFLFWSAWTAHCERLSLDPATGLAGSFERGKE